MSYTDFSLLMELYNTDFISTFEYEELLIDFPTAVTP